MSHDFLQKEMNTAYDRWIHGDLKEISSQYDFYKNLTESQRFACVIGNFNYQVCNGGFSQWHGNDYSNSSEDWIFSYIDNINTPTSQRVRSLVERAFEAILDHQEECEQFDAYNDEDEADNPNYYDPYFDTLDDEFYEINDKFLEDAEAYFRATFCKS